MEPVFFCYCSPSVLSISNLQNLKCHRLFLPLNYQALHDVDSHLGQDHNIRTIQLQFQIDDTIFRVLLQVMDGETNTHLIQVPYFIIRLYYIRLTRKCTTNKWHADFFIIRITPLNSIHPDLIFFLSPLSNPFYLA
jgi:hypothetical protein